MEAPLRDINVIFFGSSEFAVPILDSLLAYCNVKAIVTQPDKPFGRKKQLKATPVKQHALSLGFKGTIYEFSSLKDPKIKDELALVGADIFIVAAYGKIIPGSILDIPYYKSLNVHGSILPAYRGASPIHETLKNGDTFTGTTIMLMDEEMDHGPIFATSKISIEREDTFETLQTKLAFDGASLLISVIEKYIQGEIEPQEQGHKKATYTKLISKEDGRVDWNMSAEKIYNTYKAYHLWPTLYTSVGHPKGHSVQLRLDELMISDTTIKIQPGAIMFEGATLYIGTKTLPLKVIRITPEGKKTLTAEQFVRGYGWADGLLCR